MSDRCEPPEGAEDGSDHLLSHPDLPHLVVARWVQTPEGTSPNSWLMPWNPANTTTRPPKDIARAGYRYLAPVTPPAEVAALRATVARLRERLGETRMCLICGKVVDASHPPHADLPECVDPATGMAACTWQTTPDEAWQVWEGRYYEQRVQVARLEADLARLVEAGDALVSELAGSVDVYHRLGPTYTLKNGEEVFDVAVLLDRVAQIDALSEALAAIKERTP